MKRCTIHFLLAWLSSGLVFAAPADEKDTLPLRLGPQGQSFAVSLPEVGGLRFHWSAVIDDGMMTWPLSSVDENEHQGAVVDVLQHGREIRILYPGAQVEMISRTEIVGHALHQRLGLRNVSKQPVRWKQAMPLIGVLDTPHKDALLTGLHPRTELVAQLPLNGEQRIYEQGSFYDAQGHGFVFGPAGDPVSYCEFFWKSLQAGQLEFRVQISMDDVTIDPGETRWTQEIALHVAPPSQAIQAWSEEIGRSHQGRRALGSLSGWNNWNFLAQKEIDVELRDIIQTVKKSDGRLRPAVIQMDYSYDDPNLQKRLSSDWLPQQREEIHRMGARLGANIGVASRHWPGLRDFREIAERLKAGVAGGISYFKIYYPCEQAHADRKRTRFEVYRDHWRSIRQAAGNDVYLLYCNYEPDRAAVGYVDASRVGPDASRQKIRQIIGPALRSIALHDRWFSVDLDTYFTGTDIANISQIDGSWPLVRTWLSMVGMSCGSAITSDPWYWQDFQPYWRNVEILSPPAQERTEVLDLGTQREWSRLLSTMKRPWGQSHVALLWNPISTENSVTLDFAAAGMDPQQRYAVWSFWDDRYLGVAEKSWSTPRLGPSASQHLRFTPLPQDPVAPVFIGSNLHIFCGASELKEFVSKRGECQITLTDAGAREGAIFLYSRQQPVLARALGCTVSGITSAGENVWRVSLHDRRSGQLQSIDLTMPLPLYLQWWFWLLVSSVIVSLVFSAWNYLKRIKQEKARLLDQERARIARDIHDDLGASLTHIALLGELAQSDIDEPHRARAHVDDIFRAARKLTRSVDEIVWALNPANDTLDQFAAYVGDFTQDFLHSAHLHCRLEIPDELPKINLSPQVRHGLFLIIKETLHNIVTHARAQKVVFSLAYAEAHLQIQIVDDGVGFDLSSPAPSRPGGGHGLSNIRQRVSEIQGELDIESRIGHGCRVTIRLRFHS